MIRRVVCPLVLLALAAVPALGQDGDRTFRVDVVSLVDEGREVPGNPDYALEWGLYTYLFAAPENQAKFINSPDRYAVQMGGACGRMGPLSGEGDPAIHAVHDGKLYIFASEQCRSTFMEHPEKYIEPVIPMPEITADAAEKGREIVDRVAQRIGGKGIELVGSYIETSAEKSVHDAKVYSVHRKTAYDFFRGLTVRTETWNDERWGIAANADEAFMFSGGDRRPLSPAQKAVFEKETGRNLLLLLRSRRDPRTVIAYTGSREVAGAPAELVTFYRDGAATTMAVDTRGRVRALFYRGRGPNAEIGDIEERLLGFQRFDVLTLPTTRTLYFNGKEAPSMSVQDLIIQVDKPVDRSMFADTSS